VHPGDRSDGWIVDYGAGLERRESLVKGKKCKPRQGRQMGLADMPGSARRSHSGLKHIGDRVEFRHTHQKIRDIGLSSSG
jgi:hypothetical protein